MPANECIEFYPQGRNITCRANGAVVGKTFVKVSGNREGDLINVATCTAAARAFGVAGYDAADNDPVPVKRGTVLPVTCAANLTAGVEVESDAAGKAIVLASGKALGIAVTGATSGNDAQIFVY